MPPIPAIGLVVNPAAAGGRNQQQRLARVLGLLQAAGCVVRTESIPAPGEGAGTAARLAMMPGVETVLAVGGDGTLREVVDGVMSIQAPASRPRVGVLAFGTGNDAAGLLGLLDDDRVVAGVVKGTSRQIDLLEVRMQSNGLPLLRHALLFAAVGFSTDLVRATTPRLKRWCGARLSYPIGFFRALLQYRPTRLRVRSTRVAVDEEMVVVLAANAPAAGGGSMRIAPAATLDDGFAHISLIRGFGRWQIARQFIRLARGTHIHHPRVSYFTDRFLSVDSNPPQPVCLDGDLIGETPMTMELRPRALRMVAPVG